MDNKDLSRTMNKNETYYKVRTKAAEISQKIQRRVTVKEFLEIAANQLLEQDNIEQLFKNK